MGDKLWKEFEAHCHNQGLTKSRISKLRTMYNMVTRGLEGHLSRADKDDIKDFVTRLHRDDFTKQNGGAYSGNTKADAKKFLKQFYKWYEGDNWKYPEKVAWINTKIAKDEQPEEKRVLTIDEVHQLAQSMTKPEYRFLVYALFDSGFRIGEMQSVRKKDLSREAYNEEGKCWWLECRESKTVPRKVPLPLFTDEINRFTKSGYYKALDDDDELIQQGYRTLLKTLKRRSKDELDFIRAEADTADELKERLKEIGDVARNVIRREQQIREQR